MEQQPALLQVADDVFVAVLDPAAAAVVGAFVGELAVGADGVDQLRTFVRRRNRLLLSSKHVVVDFAKRRRLMNDAGAAVGRDEVGRDDSPTQSCSIAAACESARSSVAESLDSNSRTAADIAVR